MCSRALVELVTVGESNFQSLDLSSTVYSCAIRCRIMMGLPRPLIVICRFFSTSHEKVSKNAKANAKKCDFPILLKAIKALTG